MKVNINSNFNLGGSFHSYVEDQTQDHILKIFDTAINSNIFVSKEKNIFKISIIVNDGIKRGIIIKATATSDDIYHAFDLALGKILKQLRKHKSKLLNYKKNLSSLKAKNSDLPYIVAERTILEENMNDNNEISLTTIIEKETEIEELTKDEALMKMDLLGLPAFMFVNKDNGKINVIYRRPDNKISWINPKK